MIGSWERVIWFLLVLGQILIHWHTFGQSTTDTRSYLVECQPITRTDPTIRVTATRASIVYGVTTYTVLDETVTTSAPCAIQELTR